jgi:hypothetical protein
MILHPRPPADPGQDSNLDKESQNVFTPGHKSLPANSSRQNEGSLSVLLAHSTPTDPDLARIIDAWPTLPDHIRAAIMALVASSR